jgi:hypothetical protein
VSIKDCSVFMVAPSANFPLLEPSPVVSALRLGARGEKARFAVGDLKKNHFQGRKDVSNHTDLGS